MLHCLTHRNYDEVSDEGVDSLRKYRRYNLSDLASATLTNREGCNRYMDERPALNINKGVLTGVSVYEVLCE
jgi:hypothetical protein